MHPRGRKYGLRELKARRDQVYGEQTSHLVPPISYCLTQERYTLPDVGFDVKNPGARYPVRAHITIVLAQGALRHLVPSGHYNGEHAWNLNPRQGFGGHFGLPPEFRIDTGDRIRAKLATQVADYMAVSGTQLRR